MRVPCVRVDREAGERTRSRLAEAGLLAEDWDIDVADGALYIPITDPEAVPADLTVASHDAPRRSTQTMPADVLGFEPSYERLGSLAIIDEDDRSEAR